jgi:hypothetical protein
VLNKILKEPRSRIFIRPTKNGLAQEARVHMSSLCRRENCEACVGKVYKVGGNGPPPSRPPPPQWWPLQVFFGGGGAEQEKHVMLMK